MKRTNIKNIWKRIAVAALCVCTLLIGSVFLLPRAVSAAVTPEPAGGEISIGLEAISDPIIATTPSGEYYAPTGYVYLGWRGSEPILWRVVDTDEASGKAVLMSEYVYDATTHGALSADEYYRSRFTDSEWAALMKSSHEARSYEAFGISFTDGALTDTVLYIPSAKDIEDYVSNYSGTPLISYTGSSLSAVGSWWLRSESIGSVGYVSESGAVSAETNVGSATSYHRLMTTLDISSVVYSEKVNGNYALKLLDGSYRAEGAQPFAAWVKTIEGNTLTVGYINATASTLLSNQSVYVSVMIIDASGDIKYNGSVDKVSDATTWEHAQVRPYINTHAFDTNWLGQKFQGNVTFTLPEDFDPGAGDRLYMLSEVKYNTDAVLDDPSLAERTVTASALRELCIHIEGEAATCLLPPECALCGTLYGTPDVIKSSSHRNGVEKWIQRVIDYGTEGKFHAHYAQCDDCGYTVPMNEDGSFGYGERCYSSASEISCEAPGICDICGNEYYPLDNSAHDFDDNGICKNDPSHLEEPRYNGSSDGYLIENIGNLLWYAKNLNINNLSHQPNATLRSDIDFSSVNEEGITKIFSPIGSSDEPYTATFNGGGYAIKNLVIEGSGAYTGFFGAVSGATVKNIRFVNCSVRSLSAESLGGTAMVAGLAVSGATFEKVSLEKVTVSSQGYAAGFLGYDDGEGSVLITHSRAIEVNVYRADKNEGAGFVGHSESARVVSSYSYNESSAVESSPFINAENSYYASDNSTDSCAKPFDAFASGEIAYLLGEGWGQLIGYDDLPGYSTYEVYAFKACGSESTVYTNDSSGDEAHSSDGSYVCGSYLVCEHCGEQYGDKLPHIYSDLVGFVWEGYSSAHAQVKCSKCGEDRPEPMVAEITFRAFSNVRYEYTATVILDDGTVKSETKTYFHLTIEEVTAFNRVNKDFDNVSVYVNDIIGNTQMKEDEYDAYFVNAVTGERVYYFDYVTAAGTYDLHITGKNAFLNQSYVLEDAVIIRPITLTLEIFAPDKIYDGTKSFSIEFKADKEVYGLDSALRISSDKLASADIGEHVIGNIKVTVIKNEYYIDHFYGYYQSETVDFNAPLRDSVTFEYNKSTTLKIIPSPEVLVMNKNYPTEFTYGDTLPAPLPENFTVTEGSTLTFEWYSSRWEYGIDEEGYYGYNQFLTRLDSIPTDAGEYLLRVKASATDKLIASSLDIDIEIYPKELTVTIEGAVWNDERGEYEMTVKLGDEIRFNVDGYLDPTHAEDYVSYWMSRDSSYSFFSGLPTETGEYYSYVTVRHKDYVATSEEGNYASSTCGVNLTVIGNDRVILKGGDFLYNGEAHEPFMIVPEGWELDEDYTVTITNTDGEMVDEIRDVGVYTVIVTETDGGSVSATVYVRREIKISVKEREIDLSSPGITYTREDIRIETGYVLMLGHEIRDIVYKVEPSNHRVIIERVVVYYGDNDVSDLYHFNATYGVAHFYTAPCDAFCNSCSKERVAEDHTGGTATCNELAACERCGERYGEYDKNNHTDNREIYVQNNKDTTIHDIVTACCGTLIRSEKHTITNTPDCVTNANCEICGEVYNSKDKDNHVSDKTYIAPDPFDGQIHRKRHECCDGIIETERHSGGVATCKTLAECEICGASYGELDPDNHESESFTYVSIGAYSHTAYHACCEAEAHTEVHTGGSATCKTLASCERCGAGYGDLDPDNHESSEYRYEAALVGGKHYIYNACCGAVIGSAEHSGGSATCKAPASCEYCGEGYGELDPDNHPSSDIIYKPSTDPAKHEKHYTCCDKVAVEEVHSGGTADCQNLAVCPCGVTYGELGTHTYSSDCDTSCNICALERSVTVSHTDADGNKICDLCAAAITDNKLSAAAIVGISAGSAAVAGAGGFSLFWFVIRKKSLAELIAGIKGIFGKK